MRAKVILVVTGGRNFYDTRFIHNQLSVLKSAHNIDVLRHGGASGVDLLCAEWARANGITVEVYPAEWDNLDVPGAVIKVNARGPYNAVAGHLRNQKMLDTLPVPTMAIAFPGGKGTADMVRRIRAAGIYLHDAARLYV